MTHNNRMKDIFKTYTAVDRVSHLIQLAREGGDQDPMVIDTMPVEQYRSFSTLMRKVAGAEILTGMSLLMLDERIKTLSMTVAVFVQMHMAQLVADILLEAKGYTNFKLVTPAEYRKLVASTGDAAIDFRTAVDVVMEARGLRGDDAERARGLYEAMLRFDLASHLAIEEDEVREPVPLAFLLTKYRAFVEAAGNSVEVALVSGREESLAFKTDRAHYLLGLALGLCQRAAGARDTEPREGQVAERIAEDLASISSEVGAFVNVLAEVEDELGSTDPLWEDTREHLEQFRARLAELVDTLNANGFPAALTAPSGDQITELRRAFSAVDW